MPDLTPFAQAVHAVIRATEPGEVLSYGDVAREAGFPGAPRGVGSVLASSGDQLPWWRIVRADGSLPKGERQAAHLEAEGVPLTRTGTTIRVAAR